MLTDRDIEVLLAVTRYYVLNRPQIQHLCFPTDGTGRVARRRLQELVSRQLINRHRAEVVYPNSSPAGSIYYPSRKGCEFLAEYTGDDTHLVTPVDCPQPHHVAHWLAVSETHIKLDAAAARQTTVELSDWVNEWDTVNKDEQEPEKRFQLYTLLDEHPRLICAPDAAFVLSTAGFSKVFYVEQDRGTSGVRQVAARKLKGYAVLAQRAGHARHFPQTNVDSFTVLCVAQNSRRRDALRRAFHDKAGSQCWKFCSASELNSETFLSAPIWMTTTGDGVPLVKQREGSES